MWNPHVKFWNLTIYELCEINQLIQRKVMLSILLKVQYSHSILLDPISWAKARCYGTTCSDIRYKTLKRNDHISATLRMNENFRTHCWTIFFFILECIQTQSFPQGETFFLWKLNYQVSNVFLPVSPVHISIRVIESRLKMFSKQHQHINQRIKFETKKDVIFYSLFSVIVWSVIAQ